MADIEPFHAGDRVRIDPEYWDREVAGRTGTIADFPDGLSSQGGTVWIELDGTSFKPGDIDGVEVRADDLQRV